MNSRVSMGGRRTASGRLSLRIGLLGSVFLMACGSSGDGAPGANGAGPGPAGEDDASGASSGSSSGPGTSSGAAGSGSDGSNGSSSGGVDGGSRDATASAGDGGGRSTDASAGSSGGGDAGGSGGSSSGSGADAGSTPPGDGGRAGADAASRTDASTTDATAGATDSGSGPGGSADAGPPPDTTTRMICTGTSPIECHFGGAPGNYAVTVVLGGAGAAQTEVLAETDRQMLPFVTTAAGTTRRYSFVVNVRQPEGQPIEAVPPGTPGLDLYFYGSAGSPGQDAGVGGSALPELLSIGQAPAASPAFVYLAGDSTVCDQSDTDYAGWGQILPQFFDFPVAIANYADSGESSASFLASASLWGAVDSRLKTGDWVLIQFGHNDKTTTTTAFHDNITTMITQAKAKGARPALVTPPARATFSGATLTAQFIYTTPLDVVAVMKQVAAEQSVPLIDLTAITTSWYNQMGPSGWQQFHALGTDQTHTNRAGATAIAGFLATAMRAQNIGPVASLR